MVSVVVLVGGNKMQDVHVDVDVECLVTISCTAVQLYTCNKVDVDV